MLIVEEVAETAARVVNHLAFIGVEKHSARGGTEHLEVEDGLCVDAEAPVNAGQLVVLLDEVVAGRDEADVRLLAYVVLQAQDADVGVLVEEAEVIRIEPFVTAKVTRPVVGSEEQAEGVAAALARQLDRELGVDNGARVHRRQRRLKNVDTFEEERALLLEEDREALVRGDNRLIGLDLREVGVVGEVEHEVGGESEFHRHAEV